MSKQKLSFEVVKEEFNTVEFFGQQLEVKKKLSLKEVVQLVQLYLSEYFSIDDSELQVIYAEYGLKSALFNTVVQNFEIDEEDFEKATTTSLFEDIAKKVSNYKTVEYLISKTLSRIENQSSLEKTLSTIGDRLMETLSGIASGISPEMIDGVMNAIDEAKKLGIKKEESVLPVKS